MRTMIRPRIVALVGVLPLLLAPAGVRAASHDKAVEAALRGHVQVLASDDFQGREPGTDGETKTLRYLARQWFDIGLTSGTNEPGNDWFSPVTLIQREPAASTAQFSRKGRRLFVPMGSVLLFTSGNRSLVRDAPLVFVGAGRDLPAGRVELAGRVAVLLDAGIDDSRRQNALLAAGASAVLTVLDGDRTLASVAARRQRSGYALASETTGGDLEGFVTREAMDGLLRGADMSVASLESAANAPDFKPAPLDFTASLEATTRETTIRTHNLIGKLPGRRPDAGAILFVAHWDHFGICAAPPAEDLICNGAIDNASGVAVLTELARQLSKGPAMDRDVYFLATTAEELGLLGADAFADDPPIPLKQFIAAFNIDSVAIAPRGTPLAIVGRGLTRLDPIIEQVARRERRMVVPGDAANAYVRRQDGWALLQHDVPAVMVTSAYGDLKRIEHFFDTDYHRPSDDTSKPIEYGGAAQDIDFYVALAHWFADTRRVTAAPGQAAPAAAR